LTRARFQTQLSSKSAEGKKGGKPTRGERKKREKGNWSFFISPLFEMGNVKRRGWNRGFIEKKRKMGEKDKNRKLSYLPLMFFLVKEKGGGGGGGKK